MVLFTVIFYVCGVSLLLLLLGKWKHGYWKRRGVIYLEPEFFYGNSKRFVKNTSIITAMQEIYWEFKKLGVKHGGMYSLYIPMWCPIDINLIKSILVTDFSHFTDHGIFHHEKDLLSNNIFNMDGKEWKNMRNKLSPLFSPAKTKIIFETVCEKAEKLIHLTEEVAKHDEPVDIKDILLRFTNDVTGSVVFGLECNSLEDPDCEFLQYARKTFNPNIWGFILEALIPWWVLGHLGYRVFGANGVEDFFSRIVKDTIKYREENNIKRKDLFQLLLDLKNDNGGSNNSNKELIQLSVKEIISQSFIFWAGGFETSATTMTFVFLELARHPDIQEILRLEINKILEKHGGNITYEALMEMKYLDMVIEESLRMYPPFGILPRVCTKDYKVPGEEVIIKKGTKISIPVQAIQRDPDYYPDPNTFNPENFSEENKSKRKEMAWLPFGDGPRICIGQRLGLLNTKMGVASIIKNFKISLNKKTMQPIQFTPGPIIVTTIKGKLWVNIEKI